MFSLKLLLIFFIVIIIGAGALGGYYFYNQIKPSSNNTQLMNEPVTSAPVSITLEVSSPDEDTLSFEPSVLISGKTVANSPVLISSKSSDLVVTSKSDGSFSTLMDLSEGTNNIQITTFDKNGEKKDINRAVYYSKEKIQ
jgi:hypothetical protein